MFHPIFQQLKLLGKLILLFFFGINYAWGQSDSSALVMPSKLSVIAGLSISPLSLNYNFSAGSHYSLQFGNKRNQLYFLVKGGLFQYKETVESKLEVHHEITGYYLQPGVCYYLENPYTSKYTPYFTYSFAINRMKHDMQIIISDPNWGTQGFLQYSDDLSFMSIIIEYGMLFKLTDNLKANTSLAVSAMDQKEPFRKDIQNYNPQFWFNPSSGYGRFLALNFNFGVNYLF